MNCVECGAWLSIDDYHHYGGLCSKCHDEKESKENENKFRKKKQW